MPLVIGTAIVNTATAMATARTTMAEPQVAFQLLPQSTQKQLLISLTRVMLAAMLLIILMSATAILAADYRHSVISETSVSLAKASLHALSVTVLQSSMALNPTRTEVTLAT